MAGWPVRLYGPVNRPWLLSKMGWLAVPMAVTVLTQSDKGYIQRGT